MEKKTIVSMGILIAVTAAFLWMNQPSETKVNSQQSSTTIQKKPTTEPSPQSLSLIHILFGIAHRIRGAHGVPVAQRKGISAPHRWEMAVRHR